MTDDRPRPLVLPALRGVMGDWTYYSALVDLQQLAERVEFADEIQPHQGLSDMIQRGLDDKRPPEIADYLLTQTERLFNSLVIATHGGSPNWFPLSEVSTDDDEQQLAELTEEHVESVGFLTFTGEEALFAVDGQHRLAGIKTAVDQDPEREWFDEIPVIFVGHKHDDQGLVRTRRLFTTLNKNARPVSKRDTIALDEDDVMAICVRRLIEQESHLFGGERIALVAENNMPPGDETSLTTIGNLYDVLAILFSQAKTKLRRRRKTLQKMRPVDDELEAYFELARSFFDKLRTRFEELDAFFSAQDTRAVVKRYRTEGGSILFRPAGLNLFTTVVASLSRSMTLADAVGLASKLPRALGGRTLRRFGVGLKQQYHQSLQQAYRAGVASAHARQVFHGRPGTPREVPQGSRRSQTGTPADHRLNRLCRPCAGNLGPRIRHSSSARRRASPAHPLAVTGPAGRLPARPWERPSACSRRRAEAST